MLIKNKKYENKQIENAIDQFKQIPDQVKHDFMYKVDEIKDMQSQISSLQLIKEEVVNQ